MKAEKPTVQPKPKTLQDFAKAYQKLCEEYGFRIVVTPVWIARDDGTWSMQLQTSIGRLPQLTKVLKINNNRLGEKWQ